MKKQTIWILIALIIIFASVSVYLAFHKQSLSQAMTPSASETTNTTNPDRKTFNNDLIGYSVQYPSDYHVDGNYLKSQRGDEPWVQILGDEKVGSNYCWEGLCDSPTKEEVVLNGISWDYLGQTKYFIEGPFQETYRVTHNNTVYYAQSTSKELLDNVLKTFKFIPITAPVITIDSPSHPPSTCSVRPTIAGTAQNVSHLTIKLTLNQSIVVSGDVPVVNQHWSFTPSSDLPRETLFIHAFVPDSSWSEQQSMLNVMPVQYCNQ